MRTELDGRMDVTMAALTGVGGQMALASVERRGMTLPTIAAAPPTLGAYFAHFCGEHADVEFLVAGEERLTYAQVYSAAEKVARALVGGFGVKKGDRVGIAARNSPAWIVLYMGIVMAGGRRDAAQRLVAVGGTGRVDRRCRVWSRLRGCAAREAARGDRRARGAGVRVRRPEAPR